MWRQVLFTLFLFSGGLAAALALVTTNHPSSPAYKSSSIHIPIVYETDQLVVFDKPAGISHHDHDDKKGSNENDVDDQHERGGSTNNNTTTTRGILSLAAIEYPHLVGTLYGVHRLDQVTSGLLVVAKTKDMARRLTEAFTNRNVVKYYTGLSFKSSSSKKKQGWVQGYMKRGRRKSWYLALASSSSSSSSSSSLNGDGRKNKGNAPNSGSHNDNDSTGAGAAGVWAQTYFWTAGLGHLVDQYQPPSFISKDNNNNTQLLLEAVPPRTLMLFRPHTGRTHQLRVASKSLGLPLAGDPLYTTSGSSSSSSLNDNDADGPTTANKAAVTAIPRTCLHATGLYIAAECLGLKDDLILCSLPPFLQWWQQQQQEQQQQPGGGGGGGGGLEPHLLRLLEKDATIPPALLEAVKHAAAASLKQQQQQP